MNANLASDLSNADIDHWRFMEDAPARFAAILQKWMTDESCVDMSYTFNHLAHLGLMIRDFLHSLLDLTPRGTFKRLVAESGRQAETLKVAS